MAKPPAKIGFWTMVRDVLVTSLNKGQFPPAILGMIVMLMILKMPAEDVSKLSFQLLAGLESRSLLGYALAVLGIGGWSIHARFQRRTYTAEVDRVSNEKTHLQKQQLGKAAKSSGS